MEGEMPQFHLRGKASCFAVIVSRWMSVQHSRAVQMVESRNGLARDDDGSGLIKRSKPTVCLHIAHSLIFMLLALYE